MYYSEFVFKAEKLTINLLENGVWYLEPEWKDILYRNDMGDLEHLTDSFLSGWDDVEDILKLEVEKRNARRSRSNEVMDWFYDFITATVEPAMLEEETNFIKQLLEFREATEKKPRGRKKTEK